MSKTYAIAKMKFIDVSALEDATESTDSNEDIGNLRLIKENSVEQPYGTFELNQFVLDGSKTILNDEVLDITYWSETESRSDCGFEENPQIIIQFTKAHSSNGITLFFEEMYPAELKITWFSLYGTKLDQEMFYPDNNIFFCSKKCFNYGKMIIEFTRSYYPGRKIKLNTIMYGERVEWHDDMITNAKLTEEVDVTSNTLSINTLEISILDEKNEFDVGVDDGNWKNVQKTQEITVQEYKDGNIIECGKFYMNDWSFKSNIAKFKLIDAIGLIDQYMFKNGRMYDGEPAGSIIEDIMQDAHYQKYEVSEEVKNIPLYGYIGVVSCRKALHQVCFATGAVADCSRSDIIKIYMPNREISSVIGIDRKFNGKTKHDIDEYISGVSIEYATYELEAESKVICNNIVLHEGDNEVVFTKPVDPESIVVTNGLLKEVKTSYCIVNLGEESTISISGRSYSKNENVWTEKTDIINSGETENIKEYKGLTLRPKSYRKKAQSLLKYLELQKTVSMEYLIDREMSGEWVSILDRDMNMSATIIESQTIDLTGGFIAKAKCRGYTRKVINYSYAPEIFTGEETLL